jgi:hypothetical protein
MPANYECDRGADRGYDTAQLSRFLLLLIRIAVVSGPLRSFDNSIFAEHTSMK